MVFCWRWVVGDEGDILVRVAWLERVAVRLVRWFSPVITFGEATCISGDERERKECLGSGACWGDGG